jgi:hypothetical protein
MKWFRCLALAAVCMGLVWASTATSEVASDQCMGLTCANPEDPYYVPEASDSPDGSVGGPGDLARQHQAGFYEYSPLRTSDQRSVAYVAPPGELGSAPDSIRALPVVALSPREHIDSATAVVFEPGALLVEGDAQAQTEKRAASDCPDNGFCLFDCEDQFVGVGCYSYLILTHDTLPPADGWENLIQWNFGNRAESMVNHRNGDNKLAKLTNGDGAHYCAQSHSEDDTFSNNNPGNNEASSVRAFANDTEC